MNAQGMILVGAALTAVTRLLGTADRGGSFGVWRSPPPWARLIFGAHTGVVLLDDVIVAIVGLVWLVGGVAVALSGQPAGSRFFESVETLLVVVFLAGGAAAVMIWFVREHVGR